MRVQFPLAYTATGQKLQALLAPVQSDKIVMWAQRAHSPNHIGITRTYNKVEQLQRFRAAGLNTPDYTTDRELATAHLIGGRRVIGRTLYGTQGKGIQSPGRLWRLHWLGQHRQPRNIRRAWSRSEWFSILENDPYTEYRFHIVNGKSVMRMQKTHTYPTLQGPLPIRNRKNGWTFIRDCTIPTEDLRETAKKAVEALGYPWGAVDLLYNTNTGRIVVLEVNSAPGMDDRTATVYSQEIAKLVQGL